MALPDPRKRLAQQRAKEQREALKAKKKEEAQTVRLRPPVPPPEIIKLHTPFSYKGCNIFMISRQEFLVSNSDKTFLSVVKTDTGYDVYKLGVLISSVSGDYYSIDANVVRSIIDHAFSVA